MKNNIFGFNDVWSQKKKKKKNYSKVFSFSAKILENQHL